MTALRWLIGVGVLTVLVTVLGYLIHGVLLTRIEPVAAGLYRDEPRMGALLIANLAFATALLHLAREFRTTAPEAVARERIRNDLGLGVLLWLLWPVPIFLINHALQPVPIVLTAGQIALELPDMLLLALAARALARRILPPRDTASALRVGSANPTDD